VILPSGIGGRAYRLAYAPDSSAYVCGFADTLGHEQFSLWRVLATGAIDANYGHGGRSDVQIGFNDARARHLAVQPDGKVVLAGYESAGFGRDGLLVRLLPDGTLDATFSGDGILVLDSFSQLDQLDAVALMDDGSIIGGGYARVDNFDRALIIKVTSAGSLAFGFGNAGLLTPALNTNNSRVYGVAAVGQEVLAAGPLITSSTSSDIFITRRNVNGTPLIGFGTFGVAEIDVQDDDWMDDMELLPDGRIVFTGYTGSTAPGGDIDFLLGCYLSNGQPDLSFGTTGVVITETSPNYEGGFGVCAQPDGKLVVAGFGGVIGNSSLVVLRYTNDLTTNVPEDRADDTPLLYPVPAEDLVNIQLAGEMPAHITLLDGSGRVVDRLSSTRRGSLSWSVRDLPSGTYLLQVIQGESAHQSQLIIAR
jgi:uncharacterized delta-60 repeat protein